MRIQMAFTAAVAGMIVANVAVSTAATIYWDGGVASGVTVANSDWATASHWSTASNATTPDPGAAPGAADIAQFNISTVNTTTTVLLDGDRAASGLVYSTTGQVSMRGSLAGGVATSSLSLGADGIVRNTGTGTSTVSFGSGTAISNLTIQLAADQFWTNNNNSTGVFAINSPVVVSGTGTARILTLNGTSTAVNTLSGQFGIASDGVGPGNSLAIVKSGTGTWALATATFGQHTYSGGVTATQGTLSLNGVSSTGSPGSVTSGPLGTGILTMNGGTVLGSSSTVPATGTTNTIANDVTLNNVAGNTFSVVNGTTSGASTTTLSGVIGGVGGGFTKIGNGALVLTNVNTYSGDTTVNAGGTTGTLRLLNGSSTNNIANSANVTVNGILDVTGLASGTIALSSGQTLKGTGAVLGIVGGSGLVGPGNSPGILTAAATNPTGGLDYSFEMTALGDPTWSTAGASVNDVLRLVDATAPITSALSGGNTVTVNFATALNLGDVIRGGFFTDLNSDFSSLVSGADWQYTFTGGSLPGGAIIVPSVTQVASANFASGTIANGWVTTFTVTAVPEPSGIALAMIGAIGLGGLLRRKR